MWRGGAVVGGTEQTKQTLFFLTWAFLLVNQLENYYSSQINIFGVGSILVGVTVCGNYLILILLFYYYLIIGQVVVVDHCPPQTLPTELLLPQLDLI